MGEEIGQYRYCALGREDIGVRGGGEEQVRGSSHTSPVRWRSKGGVQALLVTVNVPQKGSRLPVGGEGGGVGGGDVLGGGPPHGHGGGRGGAGVAAVASPAFWLLMKE